MFCCQHKGLTRGTFVNSLLGIGLLLLGNSIASAAVLTVTAPVWSRSCDIDAPPSLDFREVLATDFTPGFASGRGRTAAVLPLEVTLSQCEAGPAGLGHQYALLITSEKTLKDIPAVFSDNPEGAAGFMVKEGEYAGAVSAFYDAPGTVENDTYSHDGFTPRNGETLDYTVGFVALPHRVLQGGEDVRASIQISFAYH